MELKFIEKEHQDFDISRVVDITKCNCEKCDFYCCPKNNYTAELTRYIYTVDEFIKENSKELLKKGFVGDLVNDFFESCVKYLEDFYFNIKNDKEVYIVKFSKKSEARKAVISTDGSSLINLSLSKDEYKWALKILELLKKINEYVNN